MRSWRCKKKHGTAQEQSLGRSCGGFTTKIHAVCDALGNPLRFLITQGEKADCKMLLPLIEGLKYGALLADRGYDSDEIVKAVQGLKSTVVIPPKKNRLEARDCDYILYKERHKIECLFGFLKHYRRLFARFDKISTHFCAFLHFIAALQWLK